MFSAYAPSTRRYLVFIPPVLLLLTVALSLHHPSRVRLNTCYINRAIERPARTWIPLGDGPLHNYSVYLMWAASLILASLPNHRSYALYTLFYSSIWFHTTYVLLAALKSLITDTQCAGRHVDYPNGISGHYCYFLYVSLTLPRLALPRLRANPTSSKFLFYGVSLIISAYFIGAVATLYRTFAHGYHSMRQILLGSALGLLSHLSLEYMLGSKKQLTGPSLEDMQRQVVIAGANSILVFALYRRWWPVEQGHAIPPVQIIFHLSLYAALATSAFFIPRKSQPKSN